MTTTLWACRWDWCTQTFPNHSNLRDHVESDHIAQVTPVKRRDVSLLKCVEDGAGMPESFLSNISVSAADSSSQALFLPRYIQRGIMTEPTASSDPESQATQSSPVHGFISVDENISSMRFAEMRGTPSPTPSFLPPSPGTSFLARRMGHNTVSPVSSRRRTPLGSPLPHRRSPEPTQSVVKAHDSTSYPTLSFPVDSDHTDSGQNHAVGAGGPSSQEIVESQLMIMDDADHGMDINSLALPAFNSQWQPQSQLPLGDSFEGSSSLPSTIDPSHWQTEHLDKN